jgi:release factor glutamine methyltransferase
VNVLDTVKKLSRSLEEHGVETTEKEAEMLVRHGLEITALEMYRDNQELNKDQIQTVEGMAGRRMKREPLQYILGHESFFDLKLLVGPGVLIPRPETEYMASHAIEEVKNYALKYISKTNNSSPRILDICTGCGCLALILAKEFPDAAVYGADVSEDALRYAHKNAELNGIRNVSFLKGPYFQPVERMLSQLCAPVTFDIIISNPPYVRTGEIEGLHPEIRDWEPRIALDGGQDGLDVYREIVPEAGRFLRKDGLIMLEVGAGQAQNVADICASTGYAQIEMLRDLSGIERIVQARWKK